MLGWVLFCSNTLFVFLFMVLLVSSKKNVMRDMTISSWGSWGIGDNIAIHK
jgi:hypothetical protein